MLHFALVVGLIECLQWTLQVTVKSLLLSLPSHFRLCLSVENKWHKGPALLWLSSVHELKLHIHKTPACTYVCCWWSGGWHLILWDGSCFSVSLQEYFAWSCWALAGQWLMSQLWRCSEQRCSTFQDKMPYESTNSLTHCVALYLAPFFWDFQGVSFIWLLLSLLHKAMIERGCQLYSLKRGTLICWWPNKSVRGIFSVGTQALLSVFCQGWSIFKAFFM